MKNKLIACLICSFVLSAPAFAVPNADKAVSTEACPAVPGVISKPGNADIPALEKRANEGSTSDAIALAQVYADEGKFVEAEKWYRFALYKNDGEGALGLYDLYSAGSIKLDDPEGVKKYGLSLIQSEAQKGNGGAAVSLAFMYLQARYVGRDYEKAREWFIVADEAGKARASYQLGMLYSNGLYFPISSYKAFYYFQRAAAAGIAPATRQVAIAYHMGIGAEKDLDKAITCYTRSADQGDALAMRDLGNIYSKDRPNAGLSVSWYKKAAALGDADSNYRLAELYKNSSPAEAKNYYATAAKKKHHLARVVVDPTYVPHAE